MKPADRSRARLHRLTKKGAQVALPDRSRGLLSRHEARIYIFGPRLRPDNTRAAKTLLSFLYGANEAYLTELEGNMTPHLDLFPIRLTVGVTNWRKSNTARTGDRAMISRPHMPARRCRS